MIYNYSELIFNIKNRNNNELNLNIENDYIGWYAHL